MEANIAALSKHQIAQLFSKHAPITQERCDHEAEVLVGGPVHPSPVQGATSYTVVADTNERVVQFRADPDALDLEFLAHVEKAYQPFMPHHKYARKLHTLHVYTMSNVGGDAVYLSMDQLHSNNCSLLQRTIHDFAGSVSLIISENDTG